MEILNVDIINQLAILVFVPLITQLVKNVNLIPINSGQKTRIRTFVGCITFLATVVTAWLNGNLESVLSPEVIEVGVVSVVTSVLAHFGYQGAKAGKKLIS